MGRRFLNEEQRQHFKEAKNKTMLERYGTKGFTNVEKVKQTKLERYGDADYNNYKKAQQTCLERYGYEEHNQNPELRKKISDSKKTKETQQKYENTMLKKYGQKSPNLVPEIRAKYVNTLIKNYGVTNPLKNKEIWKQHFETMKKNNSFSVSKAEEEFYKSLLEIYDESDIVRQYSDERYPFSCDFYIKSEDRFIEVNFHPSHGGHPFDENNPNDLLLLEQLKKDNTDWSNMIIEVWATRDVQKRHYAELNNLTYEMIYPN